MKSGFIAGIAALLLATETAHASFYTNWTCDSAKIQTQYDKIAHTYAIYIDKLKTPQIRNLFVTKDGTVYLNGKRCKWNDSQ